MTENCPFCRQNIQRAHIVLENDFCVFLQPEEPVLTGSGIIISREHRETVFDLTEEELRATFDLLRQAKERIDREFGPDGYNVGWNNGSVAGQEVFHAHLHVIPRFPDEPFVGRGIRYWLKQEKNKRHSKGMHPD
ncbi:MAG: HIT family protein [Candidatus Bipolaricaulia bacterium]